MCLKTSKGTSSLRRSKLSFCYFLNSCSFMLNFGAKNFWNWILRSWDIVIVLRISEQIGEKLILRKKALKFGNLYKVLVFGNAFAPNPSSNIKIKNWRFQSMWNLKIDFGTVFWDILTLHPRNSKSSLPTTGTFRYVESHINIWLCTLKTQNNIVYQQLLPFNMLSHMQILYLNVNFDALVSSYYLYCLENVNRNYNNNKKIIFLSERIVLFSTTLYFLSR